MSIPLDSVCMECYLSRNLELVRPLGTEAQSTRFARELMKLCLAAPEDAASPYLAPAINDLLQEMYSLSHDRFRLEKEQSNAFIMERMDRVRALAEGAEDPVFAGLQLAILGNYLDFAALRSDVSFDALDEMLRIALDMKLDRQVYTQLTADLEKGKKLLYLTDNAGEIGFDRIFAEQIARAWPHLEITFCVRGAIAQNDATREDAAAVGIPFPVIDNGNRIPATQLDMLGREAREAMEAADVIIAKGMGNTETMYGCGYNVYYAFLIKCAKFMARFRQSMMTPMLVRDGQYPIA